jgi:hypothetical protein
MEAGNKTGIESLLLPINGKNLLFADILDY